MSIELEALSPADGWAVISQAGEFWLIHPPYRRALRNRLAEQEVPKVIAQLGLHAERRSFTSWKALIKNLQAEMVRSSDPGLLRDADEASRKLLERASTAELNRHLDRLENLLREGKWQRTWRALNVIMGLSQILEEPALFDRSRSMMQRCADLEAALSQKRAGVLVQASKNQIWFKHAVEFYGQQTIQELASRVATRGQILILFFES